MAFAPAPPPEFEVDDAERRHLSDMTRHPGYRVFRKIFNGYMDALRETAVGVSLDDPLTNRDRLAALWGYVAIATELQRRLDAGVKFELDMLQKHEGDRPDPQQQAAQRRAIILGELS